MPRVRITRYDTKVLIVRENVIRVTAAEKRIPRFARLVNSLPDIYFKQEQTALLDREVFEPNAFDAAVCMPVDRVLSARSSTFFLIRSSAV